jgi:Copper binding proteins, plastocyanin/azurin family
MTARRRRLFPYLLVAVGVLVLLVSSMAAAAPTRVRVVAEEYDLTLSRGSVPNKKVRITLVNSGGLSHNLRLRKNGGTRTFRIPATQPGERTTRTFRLSPGRYRVWCSIGNHRALGMQATLRVRR